MITEKVKQETIIVPTEYRSDDYKEPETFYELLDYMRQNMPMYVGSKSLSALHMWLLGYLAGRRSAGLAPTDEEWEFRGFDEFVQKKYRWQDNSGWQRKILYRHQDEAAAVDEFFRLYDEYRESKRKQRKQNHNVNSGTRDCPQKTFTTIL